VVELKVPRTRSGCFHPQVLVRYQRREPVINQALKAVFLLGVSTRQTGHALASLVEEAVSASTVSAVAKALDVAVGNYHSRQYDDIHRANPHRPIFASETANNKTTRGEYLDDRTNGWVSGYNLTDGEWQPVASRPFLAGACIWTGFDYKGEPNPYGWPDISNHTGLMDVCGFPKDKYYYLQSWWSHKPMVHLMPMSWNWPGKEGEAIPGGCLQQRPPG
jgi:beta-galactosidase